MAAQTNDPNDGTPSLKEGLRLLESGDVDAAIANFSRVIEAEPGRAAAYRLRGSAHLRKRAYRSSIADLDQAIRLSPDDPVWDPTTFTKNRERLQNGDLFTKFMTRLLNHSQVQPLLSDEHFSVDGTLIEAWASQKSFRPKDGSGDDDDGANFHGQKRKNDTHASTSDPDSRLYRKAAGREAKLCYMGHATMENRHGLAVAGRVTHANGTAERRAAEVMLKARRKAAGRRITAGEDKAYDTADHVANLRAIGVTPHVTQNQAITKTGKNTFTTKPR
ncbi:tetratricopeptide (TPR) repeat protein [Bradyrhizobium sp. LB9.1b]